MTDLPRGAVTFLFTDIEGSTKLVKQLRDGYGEVLAAHQQLLREAFAQHGGHEIDTQGDAFFVVFSSARDAVLAAVMGQRALSRYPWPGGTELKVRMGIHTGQAAPVDGRYTGLAVHRAARIAAAGHGGQVLVSQATQTLLEDEEEDLAVTLDDLGAQRLKDLDRPVQLYQVAGPGLEADFPPIRGDDEAHAPAVEPPPPAHRRPSVMLGALAVVLLIAAVLAFLLLRGGGDGGLSSVEPGNVGIIDPSSNEIVDQVPVGLRPGPIASGEDVVWVGNLQPDRNLSRIATESLAAVGDVSLQDATPTSIAVGEGAVWAAHGRRGSLSRVDPQFGVTKTLDLAGPGALGAVTTGGGFVWAVFGDSTLARVSPGGEPRGTGFAGGNPAGIVYADGSVWVANSGDSTVSRFNPGTFEEGAFTRDINVGKRPAAIAFGEGALWTANAGDATVTRIDPPSTQTITVGGEPIAIVAGGGAVWVAEADGTVARIDPDQAVVVEKIQLGNPAGGIALVNGRVWVTVQPP